MSVNKYDSQTGTLTSLASGDRTWVGSKAAYDAQKQAGTLPNNAIICITDDESDTSHYSTEETFTGMYWVNGKPIYRRTWTGLSVTGSSNDWVNVIPRDNINDIDMIISGFILCTAGSQGRKIMVHSTWQITPNSNYIQTFASGMSGVTFDVATIEYTKTTD